MNEAEDTFEGELGRVDKGWFGPLSLALTFGGALTAAFGSGWLLAVALLSLVGGLAGFVHVFLTKPWAKMVSVSASRDALVVGDRAYAQAEFSHGHVYEERAHGTFAHPRRMFVRLERKGLRRAVVLVVPRASEGRAILRALRLDALHSVARFRTASRVHATPWPWEVCARAVWLLHLPFAAGLPIYFLAVPVVLLAVYLCPSFTEVGADGVLVRWAWTRRFLPACTIAEVSVYEDRALGRRCGVLVTQNTGAKVRIPTPSFWSQAELDLFAARIREIANAREPRTEGPLEALLARRGEGARAWIARLRALGAGANATHRVAPVRPEQLWRIVEDAQASPLMRAAAAVAVGPLLDESARTRIEETAKASVEPRLRVALSRAIDDDEDALERALDEIAAQRASDPRE